jgi:uncharacterized membrane protein
MHTHGYTVPTTKSASEYALERFFGENLYKRIPKEKAGMIRWIVTTAFFVLALLTIAISLNDKFLVTVFNQQSFQGESLDTGVINNYYLAKINKVDQVPPEQNEDGLDHATLQVSILNGKDEGSEKTIDVTGGENEVFFGQGKFKLPVDTKVVLAGTQLPGEDQVQYNLLDVYRLPPAVIVGVIFFIAVFIFGGLRGLSAIFGLAVSFIILVIYVVPQILAGNDPLTVSLIGAFLIASTSLYLAHGFKLETTIALISTLISIAISAGLSIVFVNAGRLFGTGAEEAVFLGAYTQGHINLQGLLLGGIIIGTLGVLDDITTAQTAAIFELHKANVNLRFDELFRRGLAIGQEHVTALVNTLVLAYAGSSFPLFILFVSGNTIPTWVNLNTELVVEELIRTLVGSTTLVFAVPIATFIAAYYFKIKRRGY